MSSDSPTNQDLRIIKQFLPSLKKQGEEKRKEKLRAKFDPNLRCCIVCGERLFITTKNNTDYCPECKKRLDAGETAIVSIDGRYIFAKSNGDIESEKDMFFHITGQLLRDGYPKDFTVRGCVLPTCTEVMDLLSKIYEANNAKN